MSENQHSMQEVNKDKSKEVSLFPSKLFSEGDSEFERGDSIASRTYMWGLVLGICDSFKRPVVILQKKSNDKSDECSQCKESDNISFCGKRRYSRLESTLFYEYWAVLCKKIRNQDNKNYCCEQDEIVADYLLENKEDLKDNQDLKIPFGDSEITGTVTEERRKGEDIRHICIRYHCSRSEYDELAININVNGIEGVIILGQFLFQDEDSKELLPDAFIKVVEKYYKNDMKEKGKAEKEEKKKEAKERDSLLETKRENYNEIVKNAFKCVKELEKALRDEYALKTDDHVRMIQENMVTAFGEYYHQKASELNNSNYDEVEQCIKKYELLKKALGKSLETFMRAAGKEVCAGVYYSMPKGLHYESGYGLYHDGWIVDNDMTPKLALIENTSANQNWLKIDGYYVYKIKLDLHEEKYIYVIFKQLFGDREKIKKLFDSFLQFICLEITQLYVQYNESQMTLYTKVMRHELGQLNEAILLRISAFEEATGKQAEQNYSYGFLKECRHAIENYRAHAHATMLRANSSRYFTMLPPAQKEWFYPYDSFLYKWRYIYEKAAKNKQLDFVMDSVYLSDFSRPRMYADKSMVEQVAYNLTNNALKYSIAGTAITIDCRLNESKEFYELIVTNYGQPIKEDEKKKIFEYGYRGENQRQADGSGLGLYLSREIAEYHKGTLELYTELVSDYDVSCLFLYEGMPEKFLDIETKEKIDSEILRLKKKGYMNEIRKPEFSSRSLTPYWIKEYLNKGTMKYKFVLSIPYKKRTEGKK